MKVKGIVIQAKPMTTKNGAPYISIVLHDGKTKYSISVWNADSKSLKIGNCVIVDFKDSEGFYSCTIKNIEHIPDIPSLFALIPQCVSKLEWDRCMQECAAFMEMSLARKFLDLTTSCYNLYKKATAARSNHHAFIGGLAQHTYELLFMYVGLRDRLPFKVNDFVVCVSALFHDFGKLSEYTQDFEYRDEFFLLGHPFMSAEAAGRYLREDGVDELLVKQIQHCVLAHHKRLEFGSPVVPATKEAFIVAMLDELSGIGVQYDQESGTKACGTTIYNFS